MDACWPRGFHPGLSASTAMKIAEDIASHDGQIKNRYPSEVVDFLRHLAGQLFALEDNAERT